MSVWTEKSLWGSTPTIDLWMVWWWSLKHEFHRMSGCLFNARHQGEMAWIWIIMIGTLSWAPNTGFCTIRTVFTANAIWLLLSHASSITLWPIPYICCLSCRLRGCIFAIKYICIICVRALNPTFKSCGLTSLVIAEHAQHSLVRVVWPAFLIIKWTNKVVA